MTNLGAALKTRFESSANQRDLNEAIKVCRHAVQATPDGHSAQAGRLANLAATVQTRFQLAPSDQDLDEIVALGRQAATLATAPAQVRVNCARAGADLLAEHRRAHEALPMYELALELLPLLTWRGLDRADSRYLLEKATGSLGRDAAACTLANDQHELAVPRLEQGRAILWSQLLDLRTDITGLRAAHPDIAAALDSCRRQLDQ